MSQHQARAGYDVAVDGPWQRSLRTRADPEYASAPLRGASTVEAAMMGRMPEGPGDVAKDFAALVAEQDLRASQLQYELDMLRGRSNHGPPLPSGAIDVGQFLSSAPSFQPELAEMERYLAGEPRQQAPASPPRRVAVQPTVSPAIERQPAWAAAEDTAGEDWRTKATALLHAADSASAAAAALTSTAEAIAATLHQPPQHQHPQHQHPQHQQPSVVAFAAELEPVYDPREDVLSPTYYTTAVAAMMAGPSGPAPERPCTSHGRNRQLDAMAPPMIADDEYDEDLRRIAQYERTRGPVRFEPHFLMNWC